MCLNAFASRSQLKCVVAPPSSSSDSFGLKGGVMVGLVFDGE
jgi:hypothetical protein